MRQQAAVQRKLDEILRVLPGADQRLLHLETDRTTSRARRAGRAARHCSGRSLLDPALASQGSGSEPRRGTRRTRLPARRTAPAAHPQAESYCQPTTTGPGGTVAAAGPAPAACWSDRAACHACPGTPSGRPRQPSWPGQLQRPELAVLRPGTGPPAQASERRHAHQRRLTHTGLRLA